LSLRILMEKLGVSKKTEKPIKPRKPEKKKLKKLNHKKKIKPIACVLFLPTTT